MSDGPGGVIFEVSEESTVNGVDFKFRRFIRWREPVVTDPGVRVAVPREGRSIDDQTIDLIEPKDNLIQGVRGDTAVYGARTITYDVPGQVYLTPDAGATLLALDLLQYVTDAGDVIVDRRGWGAIVARDIEMLDTIAGEPGDYIDLEVPHQVNAKVLQSPVAQRGGTRKVQITGRTPKAGTIVLQLEDAGTLAQSAPETPTPPDAGTIPVPEFTLAASVTDPLTVATATVTNDTDLEDIGAITEWAYEVSDTEPTDDGTAFGPLALGFGTDAIDTPAVPSGSTVWVRARALVVSTGERSDWSAWQSITLGPDDDGTGGTLPPFLLALAIDPATGDLSAAANSTVAEITKVYFLAGAAGGAAPLYADVIASTFVDSAGPPFTAAALATMEEGETRTVGAVGEDALGNRTVLITASITRAINTGNAVGRPANLGPFHFITEAGGLYVLGTLPAALTPLTDCGQWRLDSARSTGITVWAHCAVAGAAGSYIVVEVSPDNGASWFTTDVPISVASVGVKTVSGPMPAEGIGGSVLFRASAGGGDDAASPELYNFAFALTLATPVTSGPPDVPTGGPLGNVILDWNAVSLVGVLADGADVTAWNDDSPSDNDGGQHTTQTPPTFHETGFAGGDQPCVRFAGGSEGLMADHGDTLSEQVWYIVVGAVSTGGTGTAAPYITSYGDAGSNMGVLQALDGRIYSGCNASAFVPNFDYGLTTDYRPGPHIVRIVWRRNSANFKVYVDGALDRAIVGSEITGSWASISRWIFGNESTATAKIFMDVGRILRYDTDGVTLNHEIDGLNAVELALQEYWNTP